VRFRRVKAPRIADLLARRAGPGEGYEPAFIDGTSGSDRTWRVLAQAAAVWTGERSRLARSGSGPVALSVSDPLELISCVLGAFASGVPIAPLDAALTPTELTQRLGALGADAIVTDREATAEHVGSLDERLGIWLARGDGLDVLRRPRSFVRPPRLDAALVITSSGTTGASKVVPLCEQQLVATAQSIAAHHRLEPWDRGYSPLPLFHINALVVGVLSTLVSGGTLIVDRRFSARDFWPKISAHGATWLNLVPGPLAVLAGATPPTEADRRRVRFARSASAPLPSAVLRRFEATTGVSVLETYGMTEAASQITANPLDPTKRRVGSVGHPVDIELRVIDEDGRGLPPDQVGEIHVRGRRVISTYWSAERGGAYPAAGPDGWLPTGDVGHIDVDGFVHLAGRADDVINRSGEKVHPREVEDVLLADPGVAVAAVVRREHHVLGEEPVAVVVVDASCHSQPDDIVARLNARCAMELSRWKRPVEIIVVDSLPAGSTGKVQRSRVRALVETRSHAA
jgi:acyl-CoA synthetase (AMP-forming)/AMP-acid ligase II